jgi:hypothetical protein
LWLCPCSFKCCDRTTPQPGIWQIWGNMQVHLSAYMHVQAVASETLLLPQ